MPPLPHHPHRKWWILAVVLALVLIIYAISIGSRNAHAATTTAASAKPSPGEYRIDKNGRVDPGTYAGWRIFHSSCYTCHGVDAKGTDIAPNLMDRIKDMTPRQFTTKVLTSYRITVPLGEANAESHNALREALIEEIMKRERSRRGEPLMPAWDSNKSVRPHVLDIYAYLLARADGKLKPGKPKVNWPK